MIESNRPLSRANEFLTLGKNYFLWVRMRYSTMTSKGQITVPKAIRDALKLETGDRVQFRLRDDGVVEMLPETGNLIALFGILKPLNGEHVTVEGMERAIRRGGSRV
jgi:antitoxin PrlF